MITTWKGKWCENREIRNKEYGTEKVTGNSTFSFLILYFSVPLFASSFGFSIHEK